jgi:hypothetical protein
LDFESIVVSHGEVIHHEGKGRLKKAIQERGFSI